ncbi:hypothetical protein ACWCL1_08305 [Ligilactobacillus sp. LYQ135]
MYDNYQIVKRCLSGDYALVKDGNPSVIMDANNTVDLNPFNKAMQAFVDCYQDKVKHHFNIGNGKILWLIPHVIDDVDLTNIEHDFLNGNNFRYYAKSNKGSRYGFWYDKQEQTIMFGLLKNKRYHRSFEQQVLSMIADFCREHKDLSVLGILDHNSKITKQFLCGTEEQIKQVQGLLDEK